MKLVLILFVIRDSSDYFQCSFKIHSAILDVTLDSYTAMNLNISMTIKCFLKSVDASIDTAVKDNECFHYKYQTVHL